jgi:hypothetical protein
MATAKPANVVDYFVANRETRTPERCSGGIKPLLLTITQERVADVDLMTRNIYPTFQGILAVVNQPSDDGTFEMIDARKRDGKIIKRKFVPDHAFLMNELLFCDFIKEGQWCLFLDSPEGRCFILGWSPLSIQILPVSGIFRCLSLGAKRN